MTTVREVRVPSRTTAGEFYRALIGIDGDLSCTCAGFEYRRDCWHLKYIREERMTNESTALVPMKVEPPKSILPSRNELSVIADIARSVVNARGHAVPQAIDSPAKAMAVMLAGFELGVKPMSALRHITVINGKTEPDAQLMAGIVASREPDATIEVLEHTDELCTVRLTRPSRNLKVEFTYNLSDAVRAQLVKPGSNWQKFPKDMLQWAAVKRICRMAAPDLINSVGSVDAVDVADLLDSGIDDEDEALPAARVIEAAVEPVADDTLYNAGDAPNVDRETGEVLDADVSEVTASLPQLMDAKAWVAAQAKAARLTATDVLEALEVTPDMAGYEVIAGDLPGYKQRWQAKLDWAKGREASAAVPPPLSLGATPKAKALTTRLLQRMEADDVTVADLCRYLGCEAGALNERAAAWVEENGAKPEAVDTLIEMAAGTKPAPAGVEA